MSTFEKFIIPFISENITTMDLTSVAGFVDSYTKDYDKPSAENEFFLVYDENVHNEYTESRARRFSMCSKLKKTYIKYVNNKPLKIYSFWVSPEVKKFYNGVLSLNADQKIRILKFWGFGNSDINTMLNGNVIHTKVEHSIPLEDYNGDFLEDLCGITIKGK